MKAQQKQEKLTIKQFEWYEVQTKVREIISELLQPFNKKQNEDTVKMNQVKRHLAQLTKRVQDHDFLLQRQNAQKPKYIQLQDQKITHLQSKLLEDQANNATRLKKMQLTIEVYEQKINQLNQLEKRLDTQILQRIKNFEKYKQNVDTSISLMLKKIQSQQDENNLLKNNTRTSINKVQTKMISFDNRLKDSEDELKRKVQDINRLMDDSINHNEKIIKAELKMMDLTHRIEERQRDTKLSQKFFSKVKEVENDLSFLHKYLEAYQPLYIQLQISQTLNAFITGKQRRILCVYEQKKYAKLHNHILMNDSVTLEDLMSAYSNNIRKVINRNRKYIVNLQVMESIKYGANLYEFRVEENINDEEETKKPMNIIIPTEQIEKTLNQKWLKLQPQIQNSVITAIKPTREWIKELQEQSFIRFSKIQTHLEVLNKKQQEIKNSIELYESTTGRQVAALKQITNDNSNNCQNLKTYIKDILNFNSVLNHIVIQDEIDRQGTALYALKGNINNNGQKINPTVQLDQNCLSCNNDQKTANFVQQAFKMACLTYNPSEIKIDDQFFSREEILEISTNILERLKKKMQNYAPNMLQKVKKIPKNTISYDEQNHRRQNSNSNKKSFSLIKDSTSYPRNRAQSNEKDRHLMTLLPTLGSKKNVIQTERNTHFSVFY